MSRAREQAEAALAALGGVDMGPGEETKQVRAVARAVAVGLVCVIATLASCQVHSEYAKRMVEQQALAAGYSQVLQADGKTVLWVAPALGKAAAAK